MTEDNDLFNIEDAGDAIEEAIETGSFDLDLDSIVNKVVKKGAEGLLDKIMHGTNGARDINDVILSRDEQRHQLAIMRLQQADAKEREKTRREDEIHALEMEKLKLEIKRLGEAEAIDSSETPSVLFGELPSSPRAPSMACDANPKEFTDFLEYISAHPTSVVILGGKGYGKSALGHAILEYLHFKTGRVVVLYAPLTLPKRILPSWLRIVDSWDNIPDGAIVLVDEAALMLPSRNPGSKSNRTFTELNAISRQKSLTLIFVSQSSRSLDVNALTAGDIEIIYKKPPTFAGINERKEVRNMSKVAKKLLDGVDQARLKEYSVIFASSGDVMLMKSGLASYWSEEVSTMYKNCVGAASQPEQPEPNTKKNEILSLSTEGKTQQEIALKMGVSQAYISAVLSGKK